MADFNLNWLDATNMTNTSNPLSVTTDVTGNVGSPAPAGFDFQLPTFGVTPSGALANSPPRGNTGSGNQPWQLDWFGGTTNTGERVNGLIPTGLSALSGLTGAYLGFQQLNLAKDQLEQNKRIFNLNFTNQAQSINTQLEDRQRARVASNPGAYETVDSYMKRNSVTGQGI